MNWLRFRNRLPVLAHSALVVAALAVSTLVVSGCTVDVDTPGTGLLVQTVTPPGVVMVTATLHPTVVATLQPTPTTIRRADEPTAVVVAAQPTSPPAAAAPAASSAPVAAPTVVIGVPPSGDVASAEQAVIDLTNQYRAQAGLSPYVRDETIMNIARARVHDMIDRGYYGHYDPVTNAHLAREMIAAAGYAAGSENWYGSGRADIGSFPAVAVEWFVNDPPHAQGIYSQWYSNIGVGIAYNGQMWIVVQNFARP